MGFNKNVTCFSSYYFLFLLQAAKIEFFYFHFHPTKYVNFINSTLFYVFLYVVKRHNYFWSGTVPNKI